MRIRTRLTTLALLFISAVLMNILALVYLARAVSNSLDVIERVRERQLTASQMDAHLRDAEAALYRYFSGKDAIIAAVNLGRDTDCLAAVAGGISGALNGGQRP